nr:MAG TPA: hypothetical protein [Caudoviricetes sp.]
MKAVVLKEFRDKDNFNKVYKEGESYDFSPERYAELKALGLVESTEPVENETTENGNVENETTENETTEGETSENGSTQGNPKKIKMPK